ncbi:hypothetical protein CS542_08000 [Pedobacter sp. IW39]|nr:hypothetical protein CS542_08000 [Pedobacter sp. IW39]
MCNGSGDDQYHCSGDDRERCARLKTVADFRKAFGICLIKCLGALWELLQKPNPDFYKVGRISAVFRWIVCLYCCKRL